MQLINVVPLITNVLDNNKRNDGVCTAVICVELDIYKMPLHEDIKVWVLNEWDDFQVHPCYCKWMDLEKVVVVE